MKKAFLLLWLSFTTVFAMAQNASLQIIHNSPTPTVDIWVNGQKFLDSLEFRQATPFVNVPAGVDLEIGIAPSPSTDTSQIIADYTVNLTEDEAYIAMATGIIGDTITPFDVLIFDDARTTSNDPMNVDFFIYHGSTDAPMIDAYARGVAQLADDISFGESTDYIEVPAANYIVDITDPNNANTIIASYSAPLLTGRGAAAVVFASGFLSPPTMDDPAFGLFVALPNGTVIPLPQLNNTARLQVIHNSPSPTVDIWVNGAKLLDSFEYRTATPFIDVPAGTNLEIGVAPSPSADTSEIIATFDAILAPDAKYVAIATGIVGDMNTPFDLAIIADAQEETSQAGNTDFAIYHGSTDAPNVDVIARGVATLADSLGYGTSTDYLSVPSQDYTIDIAAATDPRVIVASYTAPLSALPDSALVVFASGFLAPDMGQPAFGLFAALPNGNIIELPTATAEAQLQIIHNSPSPTVDIWVNGSKILDSVEYRTATGFLDVPAGTNLEIGVAPSPSTDPTQIIATFDVVLNPDEAYVAIATGIVGDQNTPFDLELIDNVRTSATNPDNVDFVIYHGSTDAPTVDIIARDVTKLGDDVSYRDVSPYLEVPAANYTIDITDPIRNELIVASFLAPLSTGRGAAAVVFASGFLSPPTMDDPGFGLFVALPNGTVIPLPQLENKARLQILHNSPSPVVDIWVNDQLFLDSFEYRTATPYIDIDAATIINIGIAPSPSDDTSDIIARFEPVLTPDETYVVIATGIVGDQNTPFTLKVIEGARETAEDPSNFSTAVYHGATDAPEIDALARGVGPVASGLEYFENTAYGDIPVADYFIDITPAGDPATRLFSYEASLQGLEGQAGLIFASGFVADTSEDVSFGLFLLLPDGQVLALPEEGGVSTVTPAKLGLEMMPTLTSGEDVMISWPAALSTDYAIYVVGSQGQLVYQADVEGFNASITKNIPVNNLTKGTYQVIISNGKNLETKSFVVQ